MTSKERLVAAIHHREPDRIPIDFGGSHVTGVHVSCVAQLRDYYGLEKRLVKAYEPYQMLGWMDEDLLDAMGIDVAGVLDTGMALGGPTLDWKPWDFNGLEVLVPGRLNTTVDANGDILAYPQGDTSVSPSMRMPKGGQFFDAIIRQQPFNEEDLNPEDNTAEFGPLPAEELERIRLNTCAAAATGRGVMAFFPGANFGNISVIPGNAIKFPKGIRDVTEWYISTRTRKDYIHKVFEKQCAFAMENLPRFRAAVGDSIDVVFTCATDYGTQTSSFCSVETLRELYMYYLKQLNDWIHRNTPWKTFVHSCGAVEKFIPSFIEAGFDILNPVQCSASGMDPRHLKSAYGDRIVFWGGGVDTQKTLPFGTPQEVRREVLERCEIFSRNGGFVFNSVHNIQAGTPIENVAAMLEAVAEFNGRG